jgi:cytochrome P450
MDKEALKLTFNIISMILFGEDIHKMKLLDYKIADGTLEKQDLHTACLNVFDESVKTFFTPLNLVFPFCIDWNIGTANRRNNRNANEVRSKLYTFLESSEIQNSTYHWVLRNGVKKGEAIYDTFSFFFGGHDTSAKTICSVLFTLKKQPEWEKWLKKEVENTFGTNPRVEDFMDAEKVNEMQGLNIFMKEIFRLTPPGIRSLGYRVKEDVTLKSGTIIRKGDLVFFGVEAIHTDPFEW